MSRRHITNHDNKQPQMEISGKIIQVLPLQQGTSKAGNPWKKQEYVLETHDTYPRKVKFDFFGDRADQYPLSVGEEVTVSFDLESREFNGRWYTDVRGWKAEKAADAAGGFSPAPAQQAVPGVAEGDFPPPPAGSQAPAAPFSQGTSAEDDLPF